jgi:hypothetical protein
VSICPCLYRTWPVPALCKDSEERKEAVALAGAFFPLLALRSTRAATHQPPAVRPAVPSAVYQ